MPELPEVETMVRGIRQSVVGSRIDDVKRVRCACKPISLQPGLRQIRQRTLGQTITAVNRKAKRVLLELESGDVFVIEPRMTGLMLLEQAPDQGHLRIEWRLSKIGQSQSLWFWDRRGLGTIRLYDPDEFDQALGPKYLGPDALEMTVSLWRQQLQKTSRPIKVALLDQKLVAGIGNLYASEILYRAKISPLLSSRQLTQSQLKRLHRASHYILSRAIEYEGSTLSDGTYRNALNKDGGYQNEHQVYMKQDEPCPGCRNADIVRIVQAQRSTFFCPQCQPQSY